MNETRCLLTILLLDGIKYGNRRPLSLELALYIVFTRLA